MHFGYKKFECWYFLQAEAENQNVNEKGQIPVDVRFDTQRPLETPSSTSHQRHVQHDQRLHAQWGLFRLW